MLRGNHGYSVGTRSASAMFLRRFCCFSNMQLTEINGLFEMNLISSNPPIFPLFILMNLK